MTESTGRRWEPRAPKMRAVRAETPARELFRDAAFPASDSSLFYNLSTPLAQFREDITWRRPQVQRGLWPGAGVVDTFPTEVDSGVSRTSPSSQFRIQMRPTQRIQKR